VNIGPKGNAISPVGPVYDARDSNGRMLSLHRSAILASAAVATIAAAALYVTPNVPRNGLWQAGVWASLLLVAFYGWGSLLHRLVRGARPADAGLRLIWGAGAMAFLGGCLAAASLFSRTTAMAMVEAGAFLAAGQAVIARRKLSRAVDVAVAKLRKNGLFGLLCVALAIITVILFAGAVSDPSRNPYDDDVAYLPFARKLLETGTLIEPFSARRLTTYGGQTLFQAILFIRARFDQANAFDQGVALIVVVALIVGHPTRSRGGALLKFLAVTLLLSMQRFIINNTASYYSGLAFFFGLYRTLRWLPADDAGRARIVFLPALVAAGACTLRHSYLVPVAVFLAASYAAWIFRSREGIRRRVLETVLTGACVFAAMAPWWILAFRSSRTFLYPLMLGFGNPALTFKSPWMSGADELRYIVRFVFECRPLHTLPIFVLASACLVDTSPRRPLRSLWLACTLGFVALAHQVTVSESFTLSRYAFGYVAALVLATILAVASTVRWRTPRMLVPAGLILGSTIFELAMARTSFADTCDAFIASASERARRAPESFKTQPFEWSLYRRAQESIPAGERVAVLLDEPYYLDFARNEIFNLDMPGTISLPPGVPYFQGAEPVAKYFQAQSIRYLVFVRHQFSRFFYNRELWNNQTYNQDVWLLGGPYFIDTLETFPALATTKKILFEERGIVVLDLATGSAP